MKIDKSDLIYNVDLEFDKESEIKEKKKIDRVYDDIYNILKINDNMSNLFIITEGYEEIIDKIKLTAQKAYEKIKVPRDICYITTDNIKYPKVLFLEAGNGNKLKESIEELKTIYINALLDFYSNSSDEKKDKIIDEMMIKRNQYIDEMIEEAKNNNFKLKNTSGSFSFVPIQNKEAMTEKVYDSLDVEEKERIMETASMLRKKANILIEKIKNIEKVEIEKIKIIYNVFLINKTEDAIKEILSRFNEDIEAIKIINIILDKIRNQLVEIYSINFEEDSSEIYEMLEKIQLRVIVDNSEIVYPRITYLRDLSIPNLLGGIDYENKGGSYITDISLIYPGELIKANGGCIIMRARDIFENPLCYSLIRKVLLLGRININFAKTYFDLLSLGGLRLDDVKVTLKVILIGDINEYEMLYNADIEFKKIFPYCLEIKNIYDICDVRNLVLAYIDKACKRLKIKDASVDIKNEIFRELSREANNRNKLSLNYEKIQRMLLCYREKLKSIRPCLIEENLTELYKNNKLILNFEGQNVGTINALSVIDTGYNMIGRVIRITCTKTLGSGEIIDIQRENDLSGNIHKKSISILQGLIRQYIGSFKKINIDFYLAFEQIYGIVEGDSASLAEIICIISALSRVPIKQNIGITGSINQLGEVQPIGGVNHKIEGFYKAGLSVNKGNLGVLIPERNLDELVLSKEIESAIEKEELIIYTAKTLDEALSVMLYGDISKEELLLKIKREITKYRL